jgi:hypothetical protein
MTSTNGVLYLAPGDKCIEEARVSARSLKKYNPDLQTAVIGPPDDLGDAACFDEFVQPTYTAGRIEKVFNIHQTPFDRTLYLDSDTYICGEIIDLFDILDEFNVAAAHAPIRKSNPVVDVPDSFSELNGGVLLFDDDPAVDKFLETWERRYRKRTDGELPTRVGKNEDKRIHDQGPLCEAIYYSDVRLATLPPEYNCRFSYPGYLQDVKILHGRDPDLSELGEQLNATPAQRVFTAGHNRKMHTASGEIVDLPPDNWMRLRRSISRRGIGETIRLVVNRLFR